MAGCTCLQFHWQLCLVYKRDPGKSSTPTSLWYREDYNTYTMEQGIYACTKRSDVRSSDGEMGIASRIARWRHKSNPGAGPTKETTEASTYPVGNPT